MSDMAKTTHQYPDLFDAVMLESSADLIAGVDEAGRGPLAGPVVAAAVILDPDAPIEGLDDSKRLTAARREALAREIKEKAMCYCIAHATVDEIDEYNILKATMLAMKRAIEGLTIRPNLALVDGNSLPHTSIAVDCVIKGDQLIPAISAASILAKTSRDALMIEYDRRWPEYGFAKHKGYGVPEHIRAIERFGILPVHRRTFAPIKHMVAQDTLPI